MIAFTAPHYKATETGQAILEQGGTAIEAMVAAAASIAVVYPHMNGLGGDGFWLISEPGKAPIGIDAAGVACADVNSGWYSGLDAIPSRGGLAALTMAGAVSGWQKALTISEQWQKAMPLPDLLNAAISQAKDGSPVTQSYLDACNKTSQAFSGFDNFANTFLLKNAIPEKNEILKLSALGHTLEHLAKTGLQDFYKGDLAEQLAKDLKDAGSPINLQDFHNYQAIDVAPLSVSTSFGKLYNLPAPTQGIASLIILALFDRVKEQAQSESDFVHLLIECTKQAFIIRNNYLTDASRLAKPLDSFLDSTVLDELAGNITSEKALPWPYDAKHGDTIWMGACDNQGRMVSYIQSLYWEFGSGIVSPETGIVWNNRGTSFSLEANSLNELQPGLKPFHTLNPAFAELSDGSRMSYGTMGGEGQPQTQAALFARHLHQGKSLKQSISMGRWLLGKTWGDESNNLKLEQDMGMQINKDLSRLGHDTVLVDSCNELMGHAGAIRLRTDNSIEAASDPRSDGKALIN